MTTLPLAPVQPEPSGQMWRGLSGPFTCTGCGGQFILCPDATQTVDGTRKLCRDCNLARLDDIWDARPAGLYAVTVNGETAAYVRHTPVAPHAYDPELWRPRGAERCAQCERPPLARVHA